jgi:bidirectional [NiFe] hydrogenase diaphorase subunit
MDESCGKCIPCRAGTVQLHDLLVKITRGQATMADLILLEELADMVKHASLCGLGQNAPNPLLSTLRYFRDEYTSHIVDRACPAGVCAMRPIEPERVTS